MGLRLSVKEAAQLKIIADRLGGTPTAAIRHLIAAEMERGKEQNALQNALAPLLEKLRKMETHLAHLTAPKGKNAAGISPEYGDSKLADIIAAEQKKDTALADGWAGQNVLPATDISPLKYEWQSLTQYKIWCRYYDKTNDDAVFFPTKTRLENAGLDPFTGNPKGQ